MKIAVPDLVSNSYFPALAAVELGCFKDLGVDARITLVFPPNRAYEALREGEVDVVAASAHAAVSAFGQWRGVRLLCAQSRGMYWFLVVRSDLDVQAGLPGLRGIKGLRIGAAPWVEMGLRGVLERAGLDPERDGIAIGPIPKQPEAGSNFGLSAFRALEKGLVDGFWANGMAAELAVRHGVGKVVLDARRDPGCVECAGFTFPAMAASEQRVLADPDLAGIVAQAVSAAHARLRDDTGLARRIGERLFPQEEAGLIQALVERDLPWYDTAITPVDFAAMNAFLRRRGLLDAEPDYGSVVCAQGGSHGG